ncbi:MAG: uL13 family ribosomal protein [Minisyncoccia bacterium]
MTEKKTHTIDVTGMRIGRAASKIASILLGKESVDAVKNVAYPVTVTIENVDKLDIPDSRVGTKQYVKYSGYPGGLRHISMRRVIEKFGHSEVLKAAVSKMVPRNSLHTRRMKNLIINKTK